MLGGNGNDTFRFDNPNEVNGVTLGLGGDEIIGGIGTDAISINSPSSTSWFDFRHLTIDSIEQLVFSGVGATASFRPAQFGTGLSPSLLVIAQGPSTNSYTLSIHVPNPPVFPPVFEAPYSLDLSGLQFQNWDAATDTVRIIASAHYSVRLQGSNIVGTSVNDIIDGRPGADTLRGGPGDDTLNGDAHSASGDTVVFLDATSPVVLTLPTAGSVLVTAAGMGTDTISNFENVVGGTVGDDLTGNAGANSLDGDAGHDRLSGAAGTDTLIGGSGIDTAVYSELSSEITWTYGATGGWTVSTPANGIDSLSGVEIIQTSDRSIRLYRLQGEDMAGDFNGDGRDDIMLRNAAGTIETWESAANGSTATVRTQASPPYQFLVAGVGDFDGSGTDDVLFHQDNGNLVFWSMVGGVQTGAGGIPLPLQWHVHAVADFNGDNTDDLLLRNATSNGLVVWQMSNFGVGPGGGAVAQVTGTWLLLGTGDFDGDNKDDLLWYNSANNALSVWQMNGNAQIGGGVLGTLDASWSVQGIGDFNADGRDDILWRHQSGALAQWQMNGNTVVSSDLFAFGLSANQQIQNVGTYDTGGTADILWRDTSTGEVSLWTMNSMTVTGTQTLSTPSQDWWVV